MLTTDLYLEWGGSNRGELPPSHISLWPEGVRVAALKPRWFRWCAKTPNGVIRGDWIEAKK